MSQIELLDKLLAWFWLKSQELPKYIPPMPEPLAEAKKRARANDCESAMKQFHELQEKDFILDYEMILNKLIKDGYVIPNEKNLGEGFPHGFPELYDIAYSISFEGKLFHEQGGYKTQSKRKRTIALFQSAQTWAIAVGTVLAAFGTIGLLIFEYLKYCRNGR